MISETPIVLPSYLENCCSEHGRVDDRVALREDEQGGAERLRVLSVCGLLLTDDGPSSPSWVPSHERGFAKDAVWLNTFVEPDLTRSLERLWVFQNRSIGAADDGTKQRTSAAVLVPVQRDREETMRRTLIITTLCWLPACGPRVVSTPSSSGSGGTGSGTGVSGTSTESSGSDSAGDSTGGGETGSIPQESGAGSWGSSTSSGPREPSECEPSASHLRFASDNDIPAQLGAYQGVAVGWCDLEFQSIQERRGAFLSTMVATCERMSGRREWEAFAEEAMQIELRLSSSEDPSTLFASIPASARVRVATEPESPGAGRQSWLVVEYSAGVLGPTDPPEEELAYPLLVVTQAETIEPSAGLLNGVFDTPWYGGLGLRFVSASCDVEEGSCGELPSAVEVFWEDGEPVVLERTQSQHVATAIPETFFRTWLSSAWINEEPECTDMPSSSIHFAQVVAQP